MNEKPTEHDAQEPADADGITPPQPKPRGHQAGVKTKRRIARRIDPRNPRAVQMAKRVTACKTAETTRHAADLALAKTRLASLFSEVGGKCLEILRGLGDEELREIGKEKPVQLAIIAGICGQNLERLTIKQQSADAVLSLDLSGLVSQRDTLRAMEARQREIEALLRQSGGPVLEAQVVDVPESAAPDGGQGEAKALAAGSESAAPQPKA